MSANDPQEWNGEYFDIDDGLKLTPIEEPIMFDEKGGPYQWNVVDAVIELQ